MSAKATILAVDAESGAIRWERKGLQGITPQGTEMKRFTDAHLTLGEAPVQGHTLQHLYQIPAMVTRILSVGSGKSSGSAR